MNTSGEAHFATWHPSQCPFVIEYSRTLLAEIEQVVLESFYSAPRGGVETAGLLFGIHLEGVLRITAFRPMKCEHLHGPGFLVSDKDLIGLRALLEESSHDPVLHNSTLAGWYHSHTRSAIFLSEADLELHRRFFRENWQVALVFRPSLNTATRAGFFFQESDGKIRAEQSCQEFELTVAESAGTQNYVPVLHRQSTRRAEPVLPSLPSSELAPLPPDPLPRPPVRRLPVVPPAGVLAGHVRPPEPIADKKSRYWPWVVAGLVLGIGGASWYQSGTARPPLPNRLVPLHLRVTDQAGLLQIEWDKDTLASTVLLGGNLGIRDGETRMDLVLDRAAVRTGSFRVSRHSPNVRVTLQLRVLGAAPIEEVTEFHGAMPPVETAEAIDGTVAAQAPPVEPVEAAANPPANRVPDKAVQQQPKEGRPVERAPNAKEQHNQPESAKLAQREPAAPPPSAVAAIVAPPLRQQPAETPHPQASAPSPTVRPSADNPFLPPAIQSSSNSPPVTRPAPPPAQPAQLAQPATSVPATAAAPAAPSHQNVVTAAVPPPKPVLAPLSGHWVHGADTPTGSPFPPESLLLTLNESGGQLRGSFSGSYRVPKNRKVNGHVDFEFSGASTASSAHFPFHAADGATGEVEIIRIAGHVDTIEIVWHSDRDRITFDDVFQRVQ